MSLVYTDQVSAFMWLVAFRAPVAAAQSAAQSLSDRRSLFRGIQVLPGDGICQYVVHPTRCHLLRAPCTPGSVPCFLERVVTRGYLLLNNLQGGEQFA